MSSTLEQLYLTSHLYGGNAPYIEAWYETWLEDPLGVPEQWRNYFESMPAPDTPETGHLEVGERFRNLTPGNHGLFVLGKLGSGDRNRVYRAQTGRCFAVG